MSSAVPPVIEGSLKNTIHAVGFGLITTTLVVNFGKIFLPHFFPYMMGIVIFFEMVLFSLDRPKEVYDKYQTPGQKGRHCIEGAGSPQITVSAPEEDTDAASKKQGSKIKDKLKTKKDQKGRRESASPGSPSKQGLAPPSTPTKEETNGKGRDKETEEKGKDKYEKEKEKEKKREEEKEKKREKEEEKERQKAEKKDERDAEEEKGSWRKRLHKSNKTE